MNEKCGWVMEIISENFKYRKLDRNIFSNAKNVITTNYRKSAFYEISKSTQYADWQYLHNCSFMNRTTKFTETITTT